MDIPLDNPDAPPDKEEQVGWGTLVNVFY